MPKDDRPAEAGAHRPWADDVRQRLAQLRLNPAREAEIVDELSLHLDQRYEELRHGGAGHADARRLALEELLQPGALAEHMRTLRQARVPPAITPGAPRRSLPGDLWQDLRYGTRMLRWQPGFAAAAILTLGLGLGANSAIFALVDATLLRPLPFPNPDRLVMMRERTEASRRSNVSPLNLLDWRERARTFDAMGAFMPNVGGMVTNGRDGIAETVPRQWVTAGFFDALGVKPVAGRTFLPSDDRQRSNVVVLTEAFWRTRFDADPTVVGREIRLDGALYTVVGVAPNEAQVLSTSIWALLAIQGAPPAARTAYYFQVIGRLNQDATIEAAAADMASIAEGMAREFPNTNTGRGVTLEPLHDALIGGDLRQTSLLFLGVVGFVLLLCCANVANLFLTRATARARELAIRSALGANRPRVISQLLTESVLLAMLGGAVGVAVGAAIVETAPAVIPAGLLPSAVTLAFDLRVFAFCAAAALLVGVLFGLAPAWQATGLASARTLAASEGRTTTGRGGLRSVLVAGEVATAVLVLFGAGLLLRTLVAVDNVDHGYRAGSVLTMLVDPIDNRYPSLLQLYEAFQREAMTFPGVRSVAWATTLPWGRSYQGLSAFEIAGDPPASESQQPAADYQIVSADYFQTLDLPVVAGREFDDRDTADGAPVCIVNEAFVRRHLQGRSPIGARVAIGRTSGGPVVREIVGVARQVKGRPDEPEDLVQIYVPLAQDTVGDIFMIVRPASGRADALAPAVRAAIARVDKEQLVSVRDVMTLEDVARDATSRYRFRAVLVAAFAALALLLAMVGVFGVLAYSVQQRVRELGVRRALGATTGDVLRLVAGSALRVVAIGAIIGLALAALSSRLLAAMLYGVQPLDPMTFVLVTAVLVVTAVVSAAGPAWRATRIDPAVALRTE